MNLQSGVTYCDLCGGRDHAVLYADLSDTTMNRSERFRLVQCTSCSLVYLSPQPAPEVQRSFYTEAYVPYREPSRFARFIRWMLWRHERVLIRRLLSPGASVFEIGPAAGDYLAVVGEGYNVSGIELDPRMVLEAKRRYGFSFTTGAFESWEGRARAEFVIGRYVLEHLRSPRAALRKIHEMLPPRGYALLSVPNWRAVERVVFGRFWHGLDTPRHLFLFTPRTFERYAGASGLRVVSVRYGMVPNDWIGSIARLFWAHGFKRFARFFSVTNPMLMVLFAPIAVLGGILGVSSRMTLLLQKIKSE